jgi:proline dehydrogenase
LRFSASLGRRARTYRFLCRLVKIASVMPPITRRPLFALATSARFERAVRAVPGGADFAHRLASRYVAGRTPEDALATAGRLAAEGVLSSIDFFGENVTDPAEADRVADAYVELAGRLTDAPPGTFLSLDLSHLGIDEPGTGAQARLHRIATALPAGARVQVGAEQAARTDRILDAVLAVARAGAPVAATIQANLRRSAADAARLAEAGAPIRLVKGAYVEPAAVAHAWGDPTDLAFIEIAYALHRAGASFSLGTHDPVIREALVRVYVPFGEQWFRYAMRRAAESRGTR